MKLKPKTEYGLKLMQIFDEKNTISPLIFDYNKIGTPSEKKIWTDEITLLHMKYKLLKIEVDERVPLHSRAEGHRWFLTKDKYGTIYFMLISSSFEEKYVFKLQSRMQQLVNIYHDELMIGDEAKTNEVKTKLLEIADQYNNALVMNAQADCLISFHESNVQIIVKEGSKIDIAKEKLSDFVDENELDVMIKKRNIRLIILQILVIISLITTGVLAIFDRKSFVVFFSSNSSTS